MKTIIFITIIGFTVVLTSCEYDVATETTVHPDGALDKTVLLERKDSAKHLFNVGAWEKTRIEKKKKSAAIDSAQSISEKEIGSYDKYQKNFKSVEEVNAELSVLSDTVLQVTSKFEKNFRWFYTYITYSETYHKLNKMELDPSNYFTIEDYAFIDRLPAEGREISKADELYLKLLHDKIFDEYGETALYTEWFDLALTVVNTQPGIDSLKKHKGEMREALEKNKMDFDEETLLLSTLSSFKIPIDQSKVEEFKKAQKQFYRKINHITTANDGKYVNRINLPWTIVKTNADSVSGNSLFWAPPTIKFLIKDYTMYGECRKLNWWAVIVSVLIVGFTGYLFIRKRN